MNVSSALKIWGASGAIYGVQALFLPEVWAGRTFKDTLNDAGLQVVRTFGVALFGFSYVVYVAATEGSPALKTTITKLGIAFSVAMQINIFARSTVYTQAALTETLVLFNGTIALLASSLLYGGK